jgi:cytochrome c556
MNREDPMSRRLVLGLAACALVAATLDAAPAVAVDEPANVIKYRQAVMRANGGHLGAIAGVARGEVSFADEVLGHAHAIAEMSQNMERLFPPGSGKDDTEQKSAALPAIWERPEEFSAAIANFQEKAATFLEVAEGADQATLARELGVLGQQGCGGCHENFRERQD